MYSLDDAYLAAYVLGVKFDKFSPSVETYEEFESAMDYALRTEVDINKYSSYLQKHYTSTRVKELKLLLNNI